jgi:hypothetical protein
VNSSRENLQAWLANDRQFWTGCAFIFATLSILKGLRIPGLWAATQAYLNYQDGFIKRGLFGTVVRGLGVPIEHYGVFVTVSGFTLAVFIALLLLWITVSDVRRLDGGSLVALFAASYCVTFLAHLIGYLEIPSGVLAILALLASRSRVYLVVVFGVGVLGVLIHENYSLTFLPLTLLPAILRAFDSAPAKREFAAVLAVAMAIGTIVVLEALAPPLNAGRLASLQAEITAAVDFQPRADVLEVLSRSAFDNIAIMRNTMRNPLWWLAQITALIVFMPTTALFIWRSLEIIDARAPKPYARIIKVIVALTALCPLSLQLVGWDIYRWYALAALVSFIVLTVVWRHYGDAVRLPLFSAVTRNIVILLIAVNMATGSGLFDFYHVDTFPYVEHWRGLVQWLAGAGHWVPPPH